MLLTFPRNNDPTTIDSMKKNVEEIKEQIRYLKADLIILQRSSQSQLQEKLKIYISNIKQNLDHLKKIKKCVEHINFNFNDNANLKSRLDNIRKNIISFTQYIKIIPKILFLMNLLTYMIN